MTERADAQVRLQEQHAALRRLTQLAASEDDFDTFVEAAVRELERTLDTSAWVARTEPADETALCAPVVVDGATWGFLCADADDDASPFLDDVAELAALAVGRTSSRASLRRLSGELAALRHVATLVAEGSSLSDLFAAVARAVAQAIDVDAICAVRIEEDRSTTVIASLDAPKFPIGSSSPPEPAGLYASVVAAGRGVRVDDTSALSGATGTAVVESGIRSLVAAPIVVSGAVWGVLWVGGTRADPLAGTTEMRLRDFTELAAVAVANAESRSRLRRLADSEASLRRVATRAAEGARPAELLSAVAAETARIVDGSTVAIVQYEGDTFRVVAAHNDPVLELGSRWPVEASGFAATARETRAPVRIDDFAAMPGVVADAAREAGLASVIGAPIVVDGAAWGMIIVGFRQRGEALPAFTGWYTSRKISSSMSMQEIESRLLSFTELIGTAISRAEAQSELRELADEQAALQRVATLVAREADSPTVFDAVCAEAGRLLGASSVTLWRYTQDRRREPVAHWVERDVAGSSVEAAVIVEERRWGALLADSDAPFPPGTEQRLERFTELVAVAVANATARSELIASRARLVAAGDEARRRIERDLHDGTQQRLVALALHLQELRGAIPAEQLEPVERELKAAIEEVQELSRGVHPAQLAQGGLRPSVRALARRSPIPVDLTIDVPERPPASVETAVYYVVSEAITNAIKHSGAQALSIRVVGDARMLRATIADDGVGGAASGGGSGLTGLSDRVEALAGTFSIVSPRGGGTTITVELPVALQ